MSDFSLTLVLQYKTSKIINGMAKVQIKSERITPFGGIFHVRELFSRYMAPIIDKVLGLRCASYGYQYSEIMDRLDTKAFGLKKTSRIKAFVFKFISVPAKWIRTARHYGLNIYTHNKSYQAPFALTGGMKNLPVVFFIPSIGIKILILVLFNNILVFSNKMLVFFDRSIRIPRARTRIHKVFSLATVATLQYYLKISALCVATR